MLTFSLGIGGKEKRMTLTREEINLIDLTANWWIHYCKLPNRHPAEDQETASIIHALQRIVMARLAAREHAELFPNG